MKMKLYYMLLGALLGAVSVLLISILNLISISCIGYSFMSVNSLGIGICLPLVVILILVPIVLCLYLKLE